MKRTKTTFTLLSLLFLCLSGCNNQVPDVEKEEFIIKEASYYEPIYGINGFIKKEKAKFKYAYNSNEPLIIYSTLDEALNYLFDDVNIVKEDNKITYTVLDDLTFILDSANDTILAKNYDKINLFSSKYDSPLGLIDEESTTRYVKNGEHDYSGSKDVLFDLKEYDIDIFIYEDEFYLPFTIINYITFNMANWSSVNFNGSDFYLLDIINGAITLNDNSSPYAQSYYSGSNVKAKRTEKFVKFNYNSLMFLLDHYYGFIDDRFAPWDEYLTNNEPEIKQDLLSISLTTYDDAFERLINVVIGDGHTNAGGCSTSFANGYATYHRYQSDRTIKLGEDFRACYNARQEAHINPNYVRINGNTMILSFDGFYHSAISFNNNNINQYRNNDSFALFHYAFDQIKNNEEIKNVIFDITCNGGGDSNALIPMLGFLNREVKITMYNPLTKTRADLQYFIDTNLDGIYDENDSFKGQYNFYILTSNYSFSCANMFPKTAKEMGRAKIIGEQSGGGACVVYYTATPDGRPFRISSFNRNGDNVNAREYKDFGVAPDYELSREHFYDDEYLNNFVNNL